MRPKRVRQILKTEEKKKKLKWQCRETVMSERKNASHVGGKQGSGSREERAEEGETFDERRGRKSDRC